MAPSPREAERDSMERLGNYERTAEELGYDSVSDYLDGESRELGFQHSPEIGPAHVEAVNYRTTTYYGNAINDGLVSSELRIREAFSISDRSIDIGLYDSIFDIIQ